MQSSCQVRNRGWAVLRPPCQIPFPANLFTRAKVDRKLLKIFVLHVLRNEKWTPSPMTPVSASCSDEEVLWADAGGSQTGVGFSRRGIFEIAFVCWADDGGDGAGDARPWVRLRTLQSPPADQQEARNPDWAPGPWRPVVVLRSKDGGDAPRGTRGFYWYEAFKPVGAGATNHGTACTEPARLTLPVVSTALVTLARLSGLLCKFPKANPSEF